MELGRHSLHFRNLFNVKSQLVKLNKIGWPSFCCQPSLYYLTQSRTIMLCSLIQNLYINSKFVRSKKHTAEYTIHALQECQFRKKNHFITMIVLIHWVQFSQELPTKSKLKSQQRIPKTCGHIILSSLCYFSNPYHISHSQLPSVYCLFINVYVCPICSL